MDVELLKSTIESLGGRYDDLPENDVDALRKRLVEVCAGLKGGGGSSGGGLPSGGAPHQVLVTDEKGTAGWQDRLCYETQEEMVFLPETDLVGEPGSEMYGMTPLLADIVTGNTYTVTYNGVDYVSVAQTITQGGMNVNAFGNVGALVPSYPVTEDPFFMMVLPPEAAAEMGGAYVLFMPLDGAETARVAIRGVAENVKKIDEKFIPGYVFGSFPYKDRVFLKQTSIEDIAPTGTQIVLDEAVIPDQTYTVTYNGTPHKMIAEKSPAFANAMQMLPVLDDGQISPWYIIIPNDAPKTCVIFSEDGSCVLSIIGSGVEVRKIPRHFIESEPLVVTSPNGTKYSITVSDDGALSAVPL